MCAKSLKNRVREFREAKRWSLAKLAREADLVTQTVSKMEKDLPTTKISRLKVAEALGQPYAEVFPEDTQGKER